MFKMFWEKMVKEGKTTTNLFCKPTDGHQYLHYDSCHVQHIKKNPLSSAKHFDWKEYSLKIMI